MTLELAEEAGRAAGLLAEPHHDGSDQYVLERPEAPGDRAVVRLRVPRGADVERVVLRYVRDGEPRGVEAVRDEQTETETWWRAELDVRNAVTPYRWWAGGSWINGRGAVGHEVPEADDFLLSLDPGGPAWHLESVGYQIFPDRFARAGDAAAPDWALPRAWDEPPTGRGRATPLEWYGGDLAGIEQRLDHVEALGAGFLYLTPIFPARSNHRYDATSFERVDPLLGGDEALRSLSAAARARGMRIVGDLTLNHTGDRHEWFQAALANPEAPERSFYFFDESLPHGYETWLGVRTLPKLDWRSEELRRRLADVTRTWLGRGLDGWRIDVANMVGRRGLDDLNAEAAHLTREAVGDALLIAEHGHDFRPELRGGGWHGVMNYAGFLRPVWGWLRADELHEDLEEGPWGLPVGLRRLSGADAVGQMRAFRAGVPWQAVLHSWTLLDGHDTARFRTVAGTRERHVVGAGLQVTTPGVPMIFAGDELGLEGNWGEDGRRTMPWDRPDAWDTAMLTELRRLAALRRSSPALARGSIRYAHVSDDAIAYLRELRGERLLCLAARAAHDPVRLPLSALGASKLETLYGGDAETTAGDAVLPADGPAFHVWRLSDEP